MGDPRVRICREAVSGARAGRLDVEIPDASDADLSELGRAYRDLARALGEQLKICRVLARVAETVNSGFTLDDVCAYVYESLHALIPYDRLGLSLLEDADGDPIVQARWVRHDGGSIRLARGYTGPLRGSSLERVISTGEARILDDLEAYLAEHPESEATRLMVEEGIRSSLTCPLVALGQRVGFLFFSSRRKGTYRNVHGGAFQQVAAQLSLAIEKSRLYESLLEANRQLEAMRTDLGYRAAHDPLTTAWNRGAIEDLLIREVARSRREARPVCVLMVDVDNFKAINDTHGHAVGDVVLRKVAERLEAGLRSAEVVGRYGGDEFLIALYPCNMGEAEIVGARLRRQIAAHPVQTPAGPIAVTISLGVAVADGCLAPDRIVEAADDALYRAKRSGRNRTAFAGAATSTPTSRTAGHGAWIREG